MLHTRLRPLRKHAQPPPSESAPRPDFEDQDALTDDSPEDLFTSFLPYLFPDDAPPFHGDPGQHLLYSSPRYGELDIMVPSYPSQSDKPSEEVAAGMKQEDGKENKVEKERRLFAHFLWSAAMVVAEGIENDDGGEGVWRVNGERVLELGAG